MLRKGNTGKIKRTGYWYIYSPNHPQRGKQNYIAEHRLIIEKFLGRYLNPKETIHHINGIKTDNRIENLQLFATRGQHTKHAHPEIIAKAKILNKGRKPPNYNKTIHYCLNCTKEFMDNLNRKRKYCSHSCYGKSKIGKLPPNIQGLKLGHGWNKGIPAYWVLKRKESANYKHGKYSKYI